MPTTKFLLLLGPSGVGKSSIIRALRQLDERYTYISPYTNRQLRLDETDKICVSDKQLDAMAAAGELLVVNELFGFRYATPLRTILAAFAANNFPLLDWPISRLNIMRETFANQLFVVYIEPPSLAVLESRLRSDGRDPHGKRLRAAAAELEHYQAGDFDTVCDMKVVSRNDQVAQLAKTIHVQFLTALC